MGLAKMTKNKVHFYKALSIGCHYLNYSEHLLAVWMFSWIFPLCTGATDFSGLLIHNEAIQHPRFSGSGILISQKTCETAVFSNLSCWKNVLFRCAVTSTVFIRRLKPSCFPTYLLCFIGSASLPLYAS